MIPMSERRGYRNNNPGNIDAGSPWQGLMDRADMNAKQAAEPRFCVFKAPKWGIRAMARILITYQDKHGLDTVKGIIDRWAPPVENNTKAYIEAVSKSLGVTPNQGIDVHRYDTMVALVKAIIHHEIGGQPYTDAQIDAGLVLAGIEPPATGNIGQGRTMTGVKVITATTIAGAVTEVVAQVEPAMPFLQLAGKFLPYIVAAVVLAAVARIAWARIDDHRKGLR